MQLSLGTSGQRIVQCQSQMQRDRLKQSAKFQSKHLKASEEGKSLEVGKTERNASDMLSSFKEKKTLEGWTSDVTAAFRNKRWLLPSLAEDKSVILRPNLPLDFIHLQEMQKSQWVFISIKIKQLTAHMKHRIALMFSFPGPARIFSVTLDFLLTHCSPSHRLCSEHLNFF